MGKKGLADKVRNKRKEKAKQPPNPFEVKVNKVKHVVVNKKLQSWEKGLPGVSKSKAIKQRKNTIIKELHHIKKSNMLLDKRFGEGDKSLSLDEKMVQRFALEKKKQMGKGDFNLNEEEETLTHYGQSLAENLQDTIGSDSETEESRESGALMRTGELQFGGFSKADPMSWKEKMNEVIADSKKLKYERQAEKERNLEATNELDSGWKSVSNTLQPLMKREPGKRKPSNYMQLFHNLMMEQKSSGASEKLQTEEEKAKGEAELLQKLEADRLARMKGTSTNSKPTHVSADDLDCGLLLDVPKRVSFSVPDVNLEKTQNLTSDGDDEDQGDDDKEEEDEKDDNDESGNEGDNDSEEESSDNFSDLAEDENSDDDNDDDGGADSEEDPDDVKRNERKKSEKEASSSVKPSLKQTEKLKTSVYGKTNSIPFTFSAPGSFEELEALLHGHCADEQALILSRLRKCHHPSLAEGNKQKLEKIHLFVLRYFEEVVKEEAIDAKLVDHVATALWEMSQVFAEATATAVQKLVLERQEEYAERARAKNGRGTFVDISTLMYLQLIEFLFPTSDYRHPVTTPAFHFICQMLSECSVKSGKDVVKGLFLSSLALKYVGLSKRFVPEVITFLHGILVMATNGDQDVSVFPPLRAGAKISRILEVQTLCCPSSKWSISEMLNKEPSTLENDNFRCDAVLRCISLLLNCLVLWEDLPCLNFVVKPLLKPLSSLPEHFYPESLKESINLLKSKIFQTAGRKLRSMQQPSKKPEPLKMFEPKFDEFWTGKRKKGGPNRQANERQRLTHKYKREMKAATREIKRDNEVLARHKLDVAMQKDAERKRKTKDIFNSLANQEGDYKAMKRKK